jgi:hypothetical protein
MEGYYMTLPKPTRKPMPSLRYFRIKHHGFMLLEGFCSCSKLFNTPTIPHVKYSRNILNFITYFLKFGKVLHNLTKSYKESDTLFGVFNKHHGLNYFGLHYQRGIVHG